MISRTFLCRHCQFEFDKLLDKDEQAQCRKCGTYDLQIIPGGGHPLKTLRKRDSIMRGLAQAYNMTDMKTARAGESVTPNTPSPKQGDMDVTCAPIETTADLLAKAGPAIKQPKLPSLREKTIIEARWSRDKGEQRP